MLLGQLKCFKCLLFGELGKGLFSALLIWRFSLLGGHQDLLRLAILEIRRVLRHDSRQYGELSLGRVKLCYQFLEHGLSQLVILTELRFEEFVVLSILAIFNTSITALYCMSA